MNEEWKRVSVTRSVYEQILRHASQEAPKECCGFLTGESHTINQCHPAKNVLQSEFRYSIDPKELLQFFKELRASCRSHLGIYHSHPSSEAYPSRTDIEQAFYPRCSYLIISLKNPAVPILRAYRIIGEEVTELELQVVS